MDDLTIIGKRIRCDEMMDDFNPVPMGTEGTVVHVGGGVINVEWDNGRTLGLVVGEDRHTVLT